MLHPPITRPHGTAMAPKPKKGTGRKPGRPVSDIQRKSKIFRFSDIELTIATYAMRLSGKEKLGEWVRECVMEKSRQYILQCGKVIPTEPLEADGDAHA